MKIVILTEDSPLYIPDIIAGLLKLLLQNCHRVAAVVYFNPYGNGGLWQAIKSRLVYYGIRDFIKASVMVLRRKLLVWFAELWPGFGAHSVKQASKQYQVEHRRGVSPNNREFADWLQRQEVDLLISVACPKILKSRILAIPKRGSINYHSSLLPKYRGLQPLFWAMLSGEKSVGVSVHEIDEGIDTGTLLVQETVPVASGDSLHDLYTKTAKIAPQAIAKAVEKVGKYSGSPACQNKDLGSYFSFPSPEASLRFRRSGRRFF